MMGGGGGLKAEARVEPELSGGSSPYRTALHV